MSNSVSPFHTSIQMDVSGVKLATDRGTEYVSTFTESAIRSGQALQDAASDTRDWSDSMRRAASMVELLTAKTLQMQNAVRNSRGKVSPGIPGDTDQNSQRLLTEFKRNESSYVIADIREQQRERQNADEQSSRISLALRQNESSYVIGQVREQQRERQNADEQSSRISLALRRNESSYIIAQIRQQQAAQRTTPNNVSDRFRTVAREAVLWDRGRQAQEAAANSLREMRGMLNPMVQMQNRLADEAENFRVNMELAVRSGYMNNAQAQQLTAEFQQQNALLMQRAQQEQAGFLGMRRMGFAAQQFGYAIEDAASMYGTMGLSGAFRAAGNNLTAMAATMGPQAGVAASIAAAVASIGLHWWESKKAAEEHAKQQDEILDLTERIGRRSEEVAQLNQQSRDIARAGHTELMSMYDQNLSRIKEILALEEARNITNATLVELQKRQADLREADEAVAQNSSRFWQENLGWAIDAYEYLRDGLSGVAQFAISPTDPEEQQRALRLAEDQFNAATRLQIEQNRQEANLKRQNELEQQRLELLRKQQEILAQSTRTDRESLMSSRPGDLQSSARYRDAVRGEFDPAMGSTMRFQRGDFFSERSAQNTSVAGNDSQLVAAYERVKEIRDRMLEVENNARTTAEERLRLQEAIRRSNEELLRIEEMRLALNAAGIAADREANDMVMSRAEAANDELRFINEVARARERLNEQIAIGVRAGTMNAADAAGLRRDFNDQITREIANRDAAEGIRQRQERIGRLEEQLSGMTPAQVMGGMARGTDETRRFLEAERLRGMAQQEQEPVVTEIQGLRQQVRQLQAVMERNANAAPQAAELF